MVSMNNDPYLECQSSGDIRIRGSRVGIEQIVWAYLDGSLAEQIAIEYPTITLAQVHGAIAYYLSHRPAVDAYLADLDRTAREARATQASQPEPEVVHRLRQVLIARGQQ
jgi:uncharacterized protein (DUF433 family)